MGTIDELDQLTADGFANRDKQEDWGTFCCICGTTYRVQKHHWVYTRAARPDLIDYTLNILPLCWKHHTEAHKIGRKSFYRKYKEKLPTSYREYFEGEIER